VVGGPVKKRAKALEQLSVPLASAILRSELRDRLAPDFLRTALTSMCNERGRLGTVGASSRLSLVWEGSTGQGAESTTAARVPVRRGRPNDFVWAQAPSHHTLSRRALVGNIRSRNEAKWGITKTFECHKCASSARPAPSVCGLIL
jgi:hypothetical protein